MAFEFVALVALFGLTNAGLIPYNQEYVAHISYAAPVHLAYEHKIVEVPKKEPYDHDPHYSYSYDVHDSHTGDIKKAQETRKGDAVEGSYSLIEADGSRRIVHYTADAHHGFNAVVEKEPAKIEHEIKHEIKHEPLHVVYPATLAYKIEPVAHQEYHQVYHHESHQEYPQEYHHESHQEQPHEYHSQQ